LPRLLVKNHLADRHLIDTIIKKFVNCLNVVSTIAVSIMHSVDKMSFDQMA